MSAIDYSNLRVAIVGAGLMGRWHAKTAARLGVKLVAFSDQDMSRAESLAGEWGGNVATYATLDEMLPASRPDIVHICTPTESHYPIASQLIEAGLHVVVEKPLASSAIETQALLRAAGEQAVKLCPVHQFGFQDGVSDAIAQLDSLGQLLKVRFSIASAGGKGYSASALDQIIADIIPHPFSVLQRLRPGVKLDTRLWQGLHLSAGELQLMGNSDELTIDIHISMNARPTRCEMELFCSKGRIFFNFFHGYAIIEKGHESRLQKVLQPFKYSFREFLFAAANLGKRGLVGELAYPGLFRLLETFYQSVLNGTAGPISAEDILAIAVARDDLARRFLAGKTTGDADAYRH